MILNVTKETHGNMWTKIIRNLEMKTERVCIVRVPSFLAHVVKALKVVNFPVPLAQIFQFFHFS